MSGPGHRSEALGDEDAEWVEELIGSWVEVYKKSATTLALLRIVRDSGPLPAAEMNWSITERGLYRTLRRLADAGALRIAKVAVARTGARRQDFALTPVGEAYLRGIEARLVGTDAAGHG